MTLAFFPFFLTHTPTVTFLAHVTPLKMSLSHIPLPPPPPLTDDETSFMDCPLAYLSAVELCKRKSKLDYAKVVDIIWS